MSLKKVYYQAYSERKTKTLMFSGDVNTQITYEVARSIKQRIVHHGNRQENKSSC